MWGKNDKHQLGVGDNRPRTKPSIVMGGLKGVSVATIACGAWHTVAVSRTFLDFILMTC